MRDCLPLLVVKVTTVTMIKTPPVADVSKCIGSKI